MRDLVDSCPDAEGWCGSSEKPNYRRAIENALRSLAIEQYAAQLILDNFDQAVAAAKQDGHKTCAAMVLSRLNQIIEGV